jgi:hypothetical protein
MGALIFPRQPGFTAFLLLSDRRNTRLELRRNRDVQPAIRIPWRITMT